MKDFTNRRELMEAITPVIENTAMRYGLIPLEILLERENNRHFLRIFIYFIIIILSLQFGGWTMNIVCLDMEGVLVPEIWIAFANEVGIPELKRTTRDEPDYDKLMKYRLDILKVLKVRRHLL